MRRRPRATIDFETRSAWNLKKSNAWVYSKHLTTEAMCLKYHLPGSDKIRMWHMAHPSCGIAESPLPQDLFDWIEAGGLVEAQNSFFERCIWRNVMVARRGWPRIRHTQWRCSAAKAASHSLPRSLDMGLRALELGVEKDMEGHRLMLKLSKPRKLRKRELASYEARGEAPPVLWHEDEWEIKRLWKYCGRDVRGEIALSDELPDLSPRELRIWQMDQAINARGVWCDRRMVRRAIAMAREAVEGMNAELEELTGGELTQATKRQQVRRWLLEAEGIDLPDTTGETLDEVLERDDEMTERAKRVIEILRSANRTSTAKYRAMLLHMDPDDDRIRGSLLYCGADRTGRWSGRGVQPHNFPRPHDKDMVMEDACDAVLTGDINLVEKRYGDPMELLSSTLRGALGAPRGRRIAVADFAAIEARVVFWLAGATKALRAFRDGVDIYCDMASAVYRREIAKDEDPDERFVGKQSILGLGFGMGFPKFLTTLRKYKVSFTKAEVRRIVPRYDDIALWLVEKGKVHLRRAKGLSLKRDMHELVLTKYVVDVYRAKYPEVVSWWKELNEAAIAAVKNPGHSFDAGPVSYRMEGRFLRCRLPSGRDLCYFDPKVSVAKDPWGGLKEHLTYMGIHPKTKQWGRVSTYGGKLCENVVQATARDLMAEGMLNVHYSDTPFELTLSVHDELVAELDEGAAESEDFVRLMTDMPDWADGCPIDAEGWIGRRYRK